MAFENPKLPMTGVLAGEDLSTHQFKVMVLDGNGKVVRQTTAGADWDGVLQDKPLQDQAATVATAGETKVEAGATVAPGDLVMVDATARVIPATATNFAGGRARTGGDAGGLITVMLRPYGTI